MVSNCVYGSQLIADFHDPVEFSKPKVLLTRKRATKRTSEGGCPHSSSRSPTKDWSANQRISDKSGHKVGACTFESLAAYCSVPVKCGHLPKENIVGHFAQPRASISYCENVPRQTVLKYQADEFVWQV